MTLGINNIQRTLLRVIILNSDMLNVIKLNVTEWSRMVNLPSAECHSLIAFRSDVNLLNVAAPIKSLKPNGSKFWKTFQLKFK
jgi:hypothetical protein